MKRCGRVILPLAGVASLIATAGGDLAPQPPVVFTPGGLGTSNAAWQGVGGRTYFMQWSPDMVTWHYAPLIEFGTGGHGRGLDSSSAKFLVRLHYGDFPGITSLDEAMSADLDGDGLSNIFEVTYGYDPFQQTSTSEGADESLDPDEDGLGNASELAARANPMMKDNPKLLLQVTTE